ncbi:hypothetical protein [Indioceanicola profundi]|uniref:hypothetical protein n=1 Tax=Indioceanicola profundi TaxID=2220096 RepID=UPI000E6AC410|nr:hypothetical protein [Indioceanicola profundi]
MRTRTALRLIGLVAAGFLLIAATPGSAGPGQGPQPTWRVSCPERPADNGARFCTVTARASVLDNRGIRRPADVILHVDGRCTSLHADLPTELDEGRPAWLQVDDGTAQPFYRPAELRHLADALDARKPPQRSVAPELAGFWREVQTGAMGGADAATTELISRFARLKEGRKLGIGCETTARLLPALLAGRELRLGYHAASRGPAEPYHWALRDRREVLVRLGDLRPALDSLPPLR